MRGLIGSLASMSQCVSVFWRMPFALGAEHQRDAALRPIASASVSVGLAGQPDPPEARLGDFVERAGEVDDAHPGHDLQRARGGARERARFGRRVAVLRDDAERIERRRRAQDRADIVRIGHLIEHQQRPAVLRALLEQIAEPDILERLDLGDDALMRRVAGHQPAEIGDVGIDDREDRRQVERRQRLARAPDACARVRSGLASAAITAWRP